MSGAGRERTEVTSECWDEGTTAQQASEFGDRRGVGRESEVMFFGCLLTTQWKPNGRGREAQGKRTGLQLREMTGGFGRRVAGAERV